MDEENVEGNDLMKDGILYLQKNLSCGAWKEREVDYYKEG